VTEQVEGGIRLDPVKGKLTPLEILTHNIITPKKVGGQCGSKKKEQIYGVQKQFIHNQCKIYEYFRVKKMLDEGYAISC
jgi:hypothetical protein